MIFSERLANNESIKRMMNLIRVYEEDIDDSCIDLYLLNHNYKARIKLEKGFKFYYLNLDDNILYLHYSKYQEIYR